MSADNWTTCPRCKQKTEDKVKNAAYGMVSESEYQALLKAQNDMQSGRLLPLREDFEVGIRNGVFEVYYYASCEKCGFEFSFEHKEKVG